jgi:hypothetical protein
MFYEALCQPSLKKALQQGKGASLPIAGGILFSWSSFAITALIELNQP